jgi:hypothetical protein
MILQYVNVDCQRKDNAMKKRIFKSALNDVKYVADNEKPMSLGRFLALPPEKQNELFARK